MSREEIIRRLHAAIDLLFKSDRYLLNVDAAERSITHKLAEHLGREFAGWNVDCEYNRNRDMPKLLDLPIEGGSPRDTDARTVYPDIIIHHRNTEDNLLVIEAKKTSSSVSDEADYRKLRAFVGQLGYQHAVFLKFTVGDQEPSFEEDWIG